MKIRFLLSSVAATVVLTGTAFAADTSMGGFTMADHATAKIHYVSTTPADMMSSKLVGMNVYNNQNEKLGDVEDLVIDHGKTITGVAVSVGGFLGMGEHYVLIDPASIIINNKDN